MTEQDDTERGKWMLCNWDSNMNESKVTPLVFMSFILKNLTVHMHAWCAAVFVIVPMKGDFTSQWYITTGAVNVTSFPALGLNSARCNGTAIALSAKSFSCCSSPLRSSCSFLPFSCLRPFQFLLISDQQGGNKLKSTVRTLNRTNKEQKVKKEDIENTSQHSLKWYT